jgi:prophage DNA circulation protein
MADEWQEILYEASYGLLPLDVLTSRDSFRRALARHAPPGRDGEIVDDMGGEARVCTCRILFFARPATDPTDPDEAANHVKRAEAFINSAQSGYAQAFVHPLFGSFPAMVESIEVQANSEQRDQIVVDCTFVEQGLDPEPLRVEVTQQIEGGSAAVDVQAELARTAAAEAGLEADDLAVLEVTITSVGDEVDRWETDPDLTARDVTVGLQRLTTQISDTVAALELTADIERQPIYRALAGLNYQVRKTATRARRDSPALISITVQVTQPLATILVDVYGAQGANDNRDEVLRLNPIDDPGAVEAGTVLSVPTPATTGATTTRRKGAIGARR